MNNKPEPKKASITNTRHEMMFYIELMNSIQSSNRSINYYEGELKNKSDSGNDREIVNILLSIGCYYFWKGEYKKSIDYHIRSLEIFDNLEDTSGKVISLIGVSQGYNFLSDYRQVDEVNDKLFKIINESDDTFTKALVWLNIAEYEIMRGNHKSAEEHALKTYDICYKEKIWYLYCLSGIILGYLHLERLEISRGIEYLEEAMEIIQKHGYNVQFTLYVYYILPEAYCIDYILREKDLSEEQKKKYLKKIKLSCKMALKKMKKWSTHFGGALRANAKYYHLAGKNKKAEKFFSQSIDHCSKLGRRYELALSFLFYSIFLKQTGREKESILKLKASHRIFKEIGSRLYLSRTSNMLGLEFEEVTDKKPGERQMLSYITENAMELSAIQDLDELLVKILLSACELTNAHRGCLFIGDNKNNLEAKSCLDISEKEIKKYIKKIAVEAFDRGTIIISKTEILEKLDFLVNIEIDTRSRSILCTPIKLGNRYIGVCYLDNSVSEIFSENDSGLLSVFLSNTSMAIENAILNKMLRSRKAGYTQHITKDTEEKIKKAISYIEENYTSDISREGLAASLNINPDNLGRFFKKYTKNKISDYINQLRINRASIELRETDSPIIDIAYSVGFNSISTFNRIFMKIMKTTPSDYRSKHQPENDVKTRTF